MSDVGRWLVEKENDQGDGGEGTMKASKVILP